MDKSTAPVALDHPINSKIQFEMVDLTPEKAEQWLGRNHGNRNLRPSKVALFARDMRNGRWVTAGDPIRFDWNGNLIDGQHRCEAVISSGATIRVIVVKGLDPVAQQVIDTGAKRTPADALKFAGNKSNLTVIAGAARIAMTRAAGGMSNALSTTPTPVTNAETVGWVDDNPEIIEAAALARRTFRPIGIAPSPWAYCLWEFERINGLAAVEFATSLAEHRGWSGDRDPRAAMFNAFDAAARGRRRQPGAGESLYIAFRSWNAWVTGKTLRAPVPLKQVGTKVVGNDIPKLVHPSATFLDRLYGSAA